VRNEKGNLAILSARGGGQGAGGGSRGLIDRQINESPIINDSEKCWAGSGSTDYGRETEVLSSRD
jgi:hypothetical protein